MMKTDRLQYLGRFLTAVVLFSGAASAMEIINRPVGDPNDLLSFDNFYAVSFTSNADIWKASITLYGVYANVPGYPASEPGNEANPGMLLNLSLRSLAGLPDIMFIDDYTALPQLESAQLPVAQAGAQNVLWHLSSTLMADVPYLLTVVPCHPNTGNCGILHGAAWTTGTTNVDPPGPVVTTPGGTIGLDYLALSEVTLADIGLTGGAYQVSGELTPEPATTFVVGGGLLLVGLVLRRRRAS